jgi:hypothetical protein
MDQQQMTRQLFRRRHQAGEPRRRKDEREEEKRSGIRRVEAKEAAEVKRAPGFSLAAAACEVNAEAAQDEKHRHAAERRGREVVSERALRAVKQENGEDGDPAHVVEKTGCASVWLARLFPSGTAE